MDLVLGWRTATLLTATMILLPIAAALASTFRNRLANRTLAILILVMVGVFTPWTIGFAGFYDRWRWLTFLPVAVPLLVPAMLRFYVQALTTGALPDRWRLMLLPAAAQFAFQAASFCLPLSIKDRWAQAAFPIANPVLALALIASFAVHIRSSTALLSRYRVALVDVTSDDARFAARWLVTALIAFGILWSVWCAVLLWDWVEPLGYVSLMWLYLLIAGLALFLAIEGWRHSGDPFPTLDALEGARIAAGHAGKRDWLVEGTGWAAQVVQAGWALEPELDVATLARRLGTNTGYLSRALNEGLGLNFSAFINGLRCDAVIDRLKAGDQRDVLTIALDAGFASKASFNRAFRASAGMTPSAYRSRGSNSENLASSAKLRRLQHDGSIILKS